MSLPNLFFEQLYTVCTTEREKIKLPFNPGFHAMQNPWVPLHPSLSGPWSGSPLPWELAASYHYPADSAADPEAVLAEATSRLHSRFGFSSCTLQVEQYQPEMAQCLRCQEPPQA